MYCTLQDCIPVPTDCSTPHLNHVSRCMIVQGSVQACFNLVCHVQIIHATENYYLNQFHGQHCTYFLLPCPQSQALLF